MSKRIRLIATGLLMCALTAVAAVGQQTAPATQTVPAIVQGTISDPAGQVLPGVQVTLAQVGARPVVTLTDARGVFRFEDVRPGMYSLRAAHAGFKVAVLEVTVMPGQLLQVAFRMTVGAANETEEARSAVVSRDELAKIADAAAPPPPVQPEPANRALGQVAATAQSLPAGVVGGVVGGIPAARAVPPGEFRRYAPFADTERYAHIDVNPFKLTTAEPLSTFAADVDTASYTNVRRFLTDGQLPPVDAVRVEEFINYFHYQYPDPRGDDPVSITTEVGAAPWAPDHRLVLVGVKATPIDQRGVGGRNIVLLIDVSGSMNSPDKLGLLKTGLRMFVDTLRDDDRIAIAVYAGSSGLVLPSTSGRSRARIHGAIESLRAGGSTNGAQGIELAYQVATDEFIPGGINRVILATDGDFNVGVTSQGDLLRLIEEKKKSGIFLSVLGVGTGNLKDETMEMLADKGNGHYAYLDSLHEARRVLVREGGATLETVAKDVKFQVEFNPATVAAWKLIGYENRLLAHEDFNDDTKDGGELGAGHTVTVLYEVVPVGVELPDELRPEDGRPVVDPLTYQSDRRPTGDRGDLLTVKVRYKQPDEDVSSLMSRAVRDEDTAVRALPFAAAVAEFGLLLRDAEAPVSRWTALRDRLAGLPVVAEEAGDRQQFRELVGLAAGLHKLRSRFDD